MPRAFDTRAPVALWDPNRSDLNSNIQSHLDLGDLLLTGIEHAIDIILEEFGKLVGFDVEIDEAQTWFLLGRIVG